MGPHCTTCAATCGRKRHTEVERRGAEVVQQAVGEALGDGVAGAEEVGDVLWHGWGGGGWDITRPRESHMGGVHGVRADGGSLGALLILQCHPTDFPRSISGSQIS